MHKKRLHFGNGFGRRFAGLNSFSAIIESGDNSLNYLIYVENTEYSDTITEVTSDRKGYNAYIVNFKYIFNSELRTDNELTIHN